MADRSMFGPDWTVIPTGSGNEHHLMDHRGKVVATGYKAEKMQRAATCVNALDGIEDPAAELARLREIKRVAKEWKATREREHVIGGYVATLASVEQELFKLLDKD